MEGENNCGDTRPQNRGKTTPRDEETMIQSVHGVWLERFDWERAGTRVKGVTMR